jgi:hypothetical protein
MAKGNKTTMYVNKAQVLVMNELSICEIDGEPLVDCLERYTSYF